MSMSIEIQVGPWQSAPAAMPAGATAIAVADPHGMSQHLEALLSKAAGLFGEHAQATPEGQRTLVHLGDYIDRGPDSLGVIDATMRGVDRTDVDEVCLLGNHDRWLQAVLLGQLSVDDGVAWQLNGGLATLASFGIDTKALPEDVSALGGLVAEKLGWQRVHWTRYLKRTHRIGPYLFVHAGLDPRRPYDEQDDDDMLWVRDPFLFPKQWPWPETVCVHGHTPGATDVMAHRVGVDSGCFSSGVLSAVQLQGQALRYISAIGTSATGKHKPKYVPFYAGA